MKGEIFRNAVANRKIGYNAFKNTHSHRTSFNMGELIPTMKVECVPGDKHVCSYQNMFRFEPLANPAMVNVKITQDTFFVPYRILWPNFEKFITGELEVEPPYTTAFHTVDKGDLGDYLGLPIDMNAAWSSQKVYTFWPHAYYKIYDEWYRDQNLITEKFIELVDGGNASIISYAGGKPLIRAWHHDYFTSALPFAQKGDAVTMPLLNNQTIRADVQLDQIQPNYPAFFSGTTGIGVVGDIQALNANPIDGTAGVVGNQTGADGPVWFHPRGSLYTEMDINAEAALITDLRRAIMTQEFIETLSRVGTRYTEFVKGIFNTFTGDARLNRPEWISRHVQQMQISEVLATAESTNVPVGNMHGHGISVGSSKKYSYRVKEHGVLMCITSVQPTTSYHQGLHRFFTRSTWLDYFIPHFENIGEQAVKVKELYTDLANPAEGDEDFGYVPRYSEYKYMNDEVTGEMRDTYLNWHLSREFGSKPLLNEEFISCKPGHRIFAVTTPTEHKVIAHIYNDLLSIRPMQKYGSPSF